MKKNLLLGFLSASCIMSAQTPRMSLFEEFTGETCPPCAATNPGLNTLLALPENTAIVIPIKWQVPIPSAPSNTWSLYRTNKAEIDWRYRSSTSGGYGYQSQWTQGGTVSGGINSAPTGLIDGQHQWVFGASSDHPAGLTSAVLATAHTYTSAFSITMDRSWTDASASTVNLTITVKATAPFQATGNLMFRTVMVERLIQFSVQPGTNGEKNFEDAAIASFPTTKTGTVVTGMGTALPGTWTVGQTQTFTLSCPLPAYVRKKSEVAFVGFIQDDGNKTVAQAVRADKQGTDAIDAHAVSVNAPVIYCNSGFTPTLQVHNNGTSAITDFTVTPYVDGVAGTPFSWNGNLANGAFTTFTMNTVSATQAGGHTFSVQITNVAGGESNVTNNGTSTSFYQGTGTKGSSVTEGFVQTSFPPTLFGINNADNGYTWTRCGTAGGFGNSTESAMYNAFKNSSKGDKDELYLPPMNMSNGADPVLEFDVAYAQRLSTSAERLEVFASDDCGTTWTKFYDQTGNSLATLLTLAAGSYTPDQMDQSQWRTEQIFLTGMNKASVLIKFVVTNDNGNNVYLDNINLHQSLTGLKERSTAAFNAVVYPNPANNAANVRFTGASGTVKITVTTVAGQIVYTGSVEANAGITDANIETSHLASGLYQITVETSQGKVTRKLNVTH
jgi:hypothetical protein